MSAYKVFSQLPPWAKGVTVVGGLVLAYFGVRKIIAIAEKAKDLKGQKQTVEDSKQALQDLKVNGVTQSFSDAQYSAWASSIQAAFEGCDMTSDDLGSLAGPLNAIKNDADMYKLITAFGVRKWDDCGWFTGDVEKDLAGGVRHELNVSQINFLNKILSDKGIKFRF